MLLETPRLATNPRLALKSACLEVQAELRASKIDVSLSGTTLVFSFLSGHKLLTANVGDSRSVLGRMTADGTMQVVELSHDHKPDLYVNPTPFSRLAMFSDTDDAGSSYPFRRPPHSCHHDLGVCFGSLSFSLSPEERARVEKRGGRVTTYEY